MTTLPVIHLNGSGASTLNREYRDALVATREAYNSLHATTCHPRDFYPLGEEAWVKARAEREEALRNLAKVVTHLEDWINHLSEHASR